MRLISFSLSLMGGLIVWGMLQAVVWMGDFAKGNLFFQWMPLGAGVIFAVIVYFIMISIDGEKKGR
jgi:hypothetical protein